MEFRERRGRLAVYGHGGHAAEGMHGVVFKMERGGGSRDFGDPTSTEWKGKGDEERWWHGGRF